MNMIGVIQVNPVQVFHVGVSGTANNALYVPINSEGSLISSTTEAAVDLTLDFGFTVRRDRAIVVTNTKSADSMLAFRDDGSSVGALTIGAGATGEFDSGALSVAVASGSLCNFLRDTSASGSGSLNYKQIVEYN